MGRRCTNTWWCSGSPALRLAACVLALSLTQLAVTCPDSDSDQVHDSVSVVEVELVDRTVVERETGVVSLESERRGE